MKIKIFISGVLLTGTILSAQNINLIRFPEMEKQSARKEIRIPDISGFHTLKCDFHMHTVFSDGIVWPTARVDEAWEEGLDAIAITDHIENQPGKKHITGDHNSSYEIALEEAKEKNILLIHAGEITRDMPPGHLNAIFVNDVNLLDVQDVKESLKAAKEQGAFIMWNHPGWQAQQPDTCRWWPLHQELYEKGLINGIEVFNELEYYPITLDWCLNKKLAVICNSDVHDVTSHLYDLEKGHRPMTLVFAKKRSIESIREALFEHRTVAFFNNRLAGKEEFLKAIFEASVSFKPTGEKDDHNREFFEIKNISSVPFEIAAKKGESLSLPAESSIIVPLGMKESREAEITNLYTGSGSRLLVYLNY
jgi:hypothetical protein